MSASKTIMVCATSLTNDSFWGSIVSGSPPVLVFSSPFGSTADALLAALLPCPPWQAVTIIETATSITKSDQSRERVWVIRSLQMLWHATRVGADDEIRGSPPRPIPVEPTRLLGLPPPPFTGHTRASAAERQPCRVGPRLCVVARRAASITRQIRPGSFLFPR